jgi:hypothetical protein
MLSHIKDNNNFWTVILDGKPFQFDPTHPEYDQLVECVKCSDEDSFLEVFDVGTVIEDWSEGNFTIRDGYLWFGDNEQVASQPTQRIIDMIKSGWDHKPMLRYLDNLYANVSQRAVQESYEWSSHKGLPITEDGCMVGYKGVAIYRGDARQDKLNRQLLEGCMVDKYTGNSYRNNVGDVNHMSRRMVCDDHTKGCEQGLHIGTYEYAESWAGYGGAVVLVKFSPADIVSVPSVSQCQKIRVSRYEVIGIAKELIESEVFEEEDEDYPEDDDDYDDIVFDNGEDEEDYEDEEDDDMNWT